MFKWLRKKQRDAAPDRAAPADGFVLVEGGVFRSLDDAKSIELASKAGERKPIPFGRWVWMELPWELEERFLGYVYFDSAAGLSAKGGPESAAQLAKLPTYTVRLPMAVPIQPLTPKEISQRGLPSTPPWLHHYGPQPDPEAAWRKDPALTGRFHEGFPDDLQVLVHDGEPRRTGLQPELCWVRIVEAERGPVRRFIFMTEAPTLSQSEFARKYSCSGMVYVGKLLNVPDALESVRQGDMICFLAGGGLKHPLHVTLHYLEERGEWWIAPCSKCGFGECFDPPSVMTKLRFPDQPPEAAIKIFNSFCPLCGGMQLLSRRDPAEP